MALITRIRHYVVVPAVLVAAGCGGSDDQTTSSADSLAELKSSLPTADDFGFESDGDYEWDNESSATGATGFVVDGLFVPESMDPGELSTAIDDAGFQGGVGSHLTRSAPGAEVRVWIDAAKFDSEAGAVRARDIIHNEADLKQPCAAACVVSPVEYGLDEIPDSAAVHLEPVEGKPPEGLHKFEGYLAEFVIGPQLYVVETDGPPNSTSSSEFDEMVNTVYEAASGG
jgi:hypothetical protein